MKDIIEELDLIIEAFSKAGTPKNDLKVVSIYVITILENSRQMLEFTDKIIKKTPFLSGGRDMFAFTIDTEHASNEDMSKTADEILKHIKDAGLFNSEVWNDCQRLAKAAK